MFFLHTFRLLKVNKTTTVLHCQVKLPAVGSEQKGKCLQHLPFFYANGTFSLLSDIIVLLVDKYLVAFYLATER